MRNAAGKSLLHMSWPKKFLIGTRQDPWEERIRLEICTPWKRPLPPEPSSGDTDMDVDDTHIFAPDGVPQPGVAEDMPSDELAIEDHYDDEQPDDDHREQQDVDDALQPSVLVADAASAPVETPVDETVDPSIVSLKIEEIEGAHALHESPGVISNDAMDVDQDSDRLGGLWSQPRSKALTILDLPMP